MVAHSDELNDEKNGLSVKVDIDKRPSAVIKGLADFILYTRKKQKMVIPMNKLFMLTQAQKMSILKLKVVQDFFQKDLNSHMRIYWLD
jgi:hypothetical protein